MNPYLALPPMAVSLFVIFIATVSTAYFHRRQLVARRIQRLLDGVTVCMLLVCLALAWAGAASVLF